MLSKKVKEYKKIRQESEIAFYKSQTLLSSLRKSFKKEFNENLKRKIKKSVKVRFSEFDFGKKKKNQDAAIIFVISVNDAVVLDNHWSDEHGNDVTSYLPFSLEWFEAFCLEQSEKLGIDIRIEKRGYGK